jgi:hypothetical protein
LILRTSEIMRGRKPAPKIGRGALVVVAATELERLIAQGPLRRQSPIGAVFRGLEPA